MTTVKPNVTQRLRTIEEATGITSSRYMPFERSKITRIAAVLPLVDVSLTELRQVSLLSKQVEPVDAGYYSRVPTTDLLDISAWFHTNASGGGKYTVELIDPDNPTGGVVDGFTVKIDGPSRKAPGITRQETMFKADLSLKTNQLAQQLIASGVDPAMAYETAKKMATDNPALAYMMNNNERPQAPPPREEDEMEKLFRLAMMRDLMGQGGKSQSNSDSEVKLLRDQMKQLELQLMEERRRADESRHQAEMEALKQQMMLFTKTMESKDQSPKTDWGTLAASLTTAFGGMFSSMNSQQQAQASSQVAMLKEVLTSQTAGKSDMVNSVMANMMNMMNLQVQQQQARMQEPLAQMQVMGEMAKMTGGLLSAMVQMQKDLSGDEPAWLKVALDMLGELPEVIKSVSEPVKVREIGRSPSRRVLSGDEIAVQREVEEMQRLQSRADAVLAAPNVPVPVSSEKESTAQEPEETEEPMTEEGQREIARKVVNALAVEALVPLLDKPDWVEFFFYLDQDVEAKNLGARFVDLVMTSENGVVPEMLEKIVLFPKLIVTALERNLDWSKDRAKEFKAGMEAYKKEHNVRASSPSTSPSPVEKEAVPA